MSAAETPAGVLTAIHALKKDRDTYRLLADRYKEQGDSEERANCLRLSGQIQTDIFDLQKSWGIEPEREKKGGV